jgi:hypothetical protein
VVDQATRRALAIRDETERRRHAYLQRIEQDRERAVSQITYLFDQRQAAIAELARLQTTVQAVVEEMARSPLGRPAPGVAVAAASPASIDGSPSLPPEGETSLRPDRVLGSHSAAPVRSHSDRDDAEAHADGDGHSNQSSIRDREAGVSVADDLPADSWELPTAEQPSVSVLRLGGVFDAEGSEPEILEPKPKARRTGLFDAEQEGWT